MSLFQYFLTPSTSQQGISVEDHDWVAPGLALAHDIFAPYRAVVVKTYGLGECHDTSECVPFKGAILRRRPEIAALRTTQRATRSKHAWRYAASFRHDEGSSSNPCWWSLLPSSQSHHGRGLPSKCRYSSQSSCMVAFNCFISSGSKSESLTVFWRFLFAICLNRCKHTHSTREGEIA